MECQVFKQKKSLKKLKIFRKKSSIEPPLKLLSSAQCAWFASISPKCQNNEERKRGRDLTLRHYYRYNDRVPIKISIVILSRRFHYCIKRTDREGDIGWYILTTYKSYCATAYFQLNNH